MDMTRRGFFGLVAGAVAVPVVPISTSIPAKYGLGFDITEELLKDNAARSLAFENLARAADFQINTRAWRVFKDAKVAMSWHGESA